MSAEAVVRALSAALAAEGADDLATTMFSAALFAGLRLDDHQAHSFYIPRYPPGREATVNYPEIDLVWTNTTDSPLQVRTASTET